MIAGENRSTAGRHPPSGSPDLATVGEMLKFLRRRARLTQRQLGLAVGYTEGHICRLEQNQRPPDVATVAALFVPALGLDREPELAASLLALAAGPRGRRVRQHVDGLAGASDGQAIPASPPQAVARTRVEDGLRARLADERRVAICGLAGMGKTSVAALLAREAQPDIPVCWITVTQGVTASAEALVRQLAWFLKTHGHAEAGRLLQHRGTDAAVPLDEQLGLLGAALNRQRVLVCLDNVHLLTPDAVAMAVLAHLVATTCTTLLMTAREDVPLAGVGVYRLGGLEDPEARALVAATAPGTPPELATRLITRTGGSPMLLRLALGQLRDGLGDPAFLVERLENVAQVTSYLLETTLSGLSPAAWRVLSLLAVFRRPVDLRDEHLVELSQECDGPYDLSTALDELQRRLLVDHAAAATLHPLVHDHVYTRMVSDLPRRRRLHRVAAMWSDQVRDFLEASYHFAQAGDATRAADLLTAYSGDLVGRGKALEAAELTESLLRARRPVGDDADALLVDLLTVRGDLLANTVRVADAEAAYRQAMELVNGPRRAQIASRLAQLLIQRGDAPEAVRLCRQAAATVGAANHLLLARIAATTSQAQNRLSNYPEATAEADRALELAGRATGGPPQAVAEVQARAHLTLGQATRIHRRLDAAVAHLTRAVDAALRADRPELVSQARHTLAVVYFEQGDMDAAVALFTEVLARFRQIGDGYGAARVLLALTQVFLNQSALHRALESTTEASEIRLRLGDRPGVANANCVRAEVLLAYGDLDQARDLIEEVVATSTEICSTRERGYQLAVLAQAHLVAGNAAAAVAALRTGLVLPDIAGTALQLLLHEYLAMALIIAGDVDQAEQILSRPDGERAIGAEVPPGIRLDAYAVEVARAIARDDRAAAAQWVATMARYAGETGRTRYREVAARLATAVAGTATPAELPRLIWGA